jgi:malate dehydrogenase (oxaloacetate-decarboxylating)
MPPLASALDAQTGGDSLRDRALNLRRRNGGVLEVRSKIPIKDHHILNVLYVPPAVLAPAAEIRRDPMSVYELTVKENLVAIATDGSAVLGLGDIGAEAALPVMEGKAVLFQTLAGVEAFPICISERDPERIAEIIANISPAFGAINLEDISAPRCFEVERILREKLDLPVFHDDQHGTAIVVLAALLNALRLRGTTMDQAQIVINGGGAAGIAVGRLLLAHGLGDLIVCDRRGAIYRGRNVDMNPAKDEIAEISNREGCTGDLKEALRGADVFIGLSVAGALAVEDIGVMAERPIIIALAKPTPEIAPDEAWAAGAFVVATGRSDFPNQVNNSLAFPGVFRGALDARASEINDEMKVAAANAIAGLVGAHELEPHYIMPEALDLRVAPAVAAAVAKAAADCGVARTEVNPERIRQRTLDMIYSGHLAGWD